MTKDTLTTGALRTALVSDQQIAVSAADAARIAPVVEASLSVARAVLKDSLFDTEPAHFDRFVRSCAAGDGQ